MFSFLLQRRVGASASLRRASRSHHFLEGGNGRASRPLALGALLFLTALAGQPAAAQTVAVQPSQVTGDQRLYGKHSPSACSPTASRQPKQATVEEAQCLSRRERRRRRQHYQDQHRAEFPAVYAPGIE